MEKSIWFVGWKDTEGKYNEVKVGLNQIEPMCTKDTGDGEMQPLLKYIVANYGQYAWDNMIYLQNIKLIDEEKGYYEMFSSDPHNIYPGTKGKTMIVDENRNIIKDISDTIVKRVKRHDHT